MEVYSFSELSSLSNEELATMAKNGDDCAFGILVTRFMPLVKNRALRFKSHSVDEDDLIQEGLLGLLKSVQTYKPEKGASFAHYTDICVSAKLLTAVNSFGTNGRKLLNNYLPLDEYDNIGIDFAGSDLGQDPSSLFIKKEELEHMQRQAKVLLTSFEQTALSLYLSGHSYYEMAKKMNTSQKAVDNALQRVRRKLRT